MSITRIGHIIFATENSDLISNCYAGYLLQSKARNKHRVYKDVKLIYLNRQYVDKNKGLFKLKQDEKYCIQKEHGLYFYVDVLNTYFNPNYATFRSFLRNILIDRFIIVFGDGVGPYSIYLSYKNSIIIGYQYNNNCRSFIDINRRINKVPNTYCPQIDSIYNYFIPRPVTIVSIMPFQIIEYLVTKGFNIPYTEHYCIIHIKEYKIKILSTIINANYKILKIKKYSNNSFIYLIKFTKIQGVLNYPK